MLAGCAAAVVLVGGRAEADFICGEPVNLGPTVNCPDIESAACISGDGLELYCSRRPAAGAGSGDIWVAARRTTNDPWSEAVILGVNVNTPDDESDPALSSDGLELYFVRGSNAPRILLATRQSRDDPWGPPVVLSELGNAREPAISTDGLEIYFCCNRSQVFLKKIEKIA